MNIPNCDARQTAELGRQLKARVGLALDEREKIPCRICSTPTPMLGTQLCDRCWELEGRIKRDPRLALKILASLPEGEFIDEALVGFAKAHRGGRWKFWTRLKKG